MGVLSELEPKDVFRYFEEICGIPHGSFHTKQISDHLAAFARANGLRYKQDEAGNVIIWKNGSAGYEDKEPVILQGHMDMVCEKEAGCPKDLEKDGLDLMIEDGFVTAKGTTLGGDDGIAVAMAMALLADPEAVHPPIEAVFTVDEEVGMCGAAALDMSVLKGRRLLNLDSEDEGIFTISCAGGNVSTAILPVEREKAVGAQEKRILIEVGGLTGGHSGNEIHRGRANANDLMARILPAILKAADCRLIEGAGGLKDNAIPVSCAASVVVTEAEKAVEAAEAFGAILKKEYAATDPDLFVKVRTDDSEASGPAPMTRESTVKVVTMLNCVPNGLYLLSPTIKGLTQTSLNLGILKTVAGEGNEPDSVRATFCIRSSFDTQKEALVNEIELLMAQLGGHVDVAGIYPGWAYQAESPLRDLVAEVYREQTGKEPVLEAIHAGIECGYFAGKIPGVDCISIGPDLIDIHTPKERLSIASTQRTFALVKEVLRRM